jgi:hypothetical protein
LKFSVRRQLIEVGAAQNDVSAAHKTAKAEATLENGQ